MQPQIQPQAQADTDAVAADVARQLAERGSSQQGLVELGFRAPQTFSISLPTGTVAGIVARWLWRLAC